MSKRIVLNSFRALSFDVLVRQAPSRAMHRPSPTLEHRPALPPDGGRPVVGRWPLWATNEREALELSRNQQPELLFLDFNRPLKRAMNSFEQLQGASGFVPVILITENKAGFERAEAGRVAALIRKPFQVSLLLRTMSEVLHPVSEPAQPDVLEQHAQIPSQ